MPLNTVFLSLGSNDSPRQHLCAALDALNQLLKDMACSAVYESDPVGISSAPFLNMAVSGRTEKSPDALKQQLKRIERDNGRIADEQTRIPLDIDLLLVISAQGAIERWHEEALSQEYVLWPMSGLASERMHPGRHRTFGQLRQELSVSQHIRPVEFEWQGRILTP